MNMNKIIKIISLLFCVFSLISMKAQNDSRVAQIPEIVDLYEQLENMFPYSDYVNLTQTEVSYWVNNNMKQTEDFAQGLKKMQSAIKKIKAIYGDDNIVVESTNSDDSLVFACRPNYHDSVQSNYMEIVYNREKVHFYYGSSLNDKSANYHEANDNIVVDIDNMLKTFMMRSGVTKDSIVFDGPSYKYQLVTFTNFQQMMQHAEGVVYNIPNAKHSDWLFRTEPGTDARRRADSLRDYRPCGERRDTPAHKRYPRSLHVRRRSFREKSEGAFWRRT